MSAMLKAPVALAVMLMLTLLAATSGAADTAAARLVRDETGPTPGLDGCAVRAGPETCEKVLDLDRTGDARPWFETDDARVSPLMDGNRVQSSQRGSVTAFPPSGATLLGSAFPHSAIAPSPAVRPTATVPDYTSPNASSGQQAGMPRMDRPVPLGAAALLLTAMLAVCALVFARRNRRS